MIDNLKIFLGISKDDTSKDELLNLIIDTTTSRLKVLLGDIEPPTSLNYIILEVSIVRFNRIGSEGLSTHSVEGESQAFNEKDFDKYRGDIQAYLDTLSANTKGRLRFI